MGIFDNNGLFVFCFYFAFSYVCRDLVESFFSLAG